MSEMGKSFVETEEKDYFDPFIGELVPDDGFAFTLLSCHCSSHAVHVLEPMQLRLPASLEEKVLAIKGASIVLRNPEEKDTEFLINMWNNKAIMGPVGYPEGLNATKESLARWFKLINSEEHQKRNSTFIIENEKGAPIGECGIYEFNLAHQSGEIAVKIGDEASLGKGIEAEAIKILTKYLFENTSLESIITEVLESDEASAKAYESNGYKYTGWTREYFSRKAKGMRRMKVYELVNPNLGAKK